jgi:DNA-binding NarL/FixJ family response regulator
MIAVVLVDDHEVVVQGLRLLLGELDDVTVVGSANDGMAGVEAGALCCAPTWS